MAKKNPLMEIVTKIVGLLEPLEPEERLRAIQMSLTYFRQPLKSAEAEDKEDGEDGRTSRANATAQRWLTQNQISASKIEQVYHDADGVFSVIAEIPGKNNKEKTLNAYVLEGIRNLLSAGKATFDDQSARELCKSSGCYDAGNHAYYLQQKKNLFTGTKEKGWTLTAPGLRQGAELVKELTKKSE